MEYNLLKTIERPMALLMPTETLPRLTPYPATDFVNPGLGQISRLYSFYVPLYTQKNIHAIEKKVENVDNLEGNGQASTVTEVENELEANPIEFNDNKRKRLGSPVHESFLHPKMIKTDHIYLKQLPKTEVKKIEKTKTAEPKVYHESKTVKHKFQFH